MFRDLELMFEILCHDNLQISKRAFYDSTLNERGIKTRNSEACNKQSQIENFFNEQTNRL